MADRFAMDFGASSMRQVRRVSEEEARFGGIAPAPAAHEQSAPAGPAPLFLPGDSLVDAIDGLISRDGAAPLGLAGCERIDTHIRREHKTRIKVFCATHGLTMRQVMELAFEAMVCAMDEYDARA